MLFIQISSDICENVFEYHSAFIFIQIILSLKGAFSFKCLVGM